MTACKRLAAGGIGLLALGLGLVLADDFERAPINYRQASANNPVSRLQQRLDAGEAKLVHENSFGYLRSLLKELEVPESSQLLVFSKTSLQRQRIGPKTPRALYFNDEVYVGYCHLGDVLEISAADPDLGTVFYTLEQRPLQRPRILRQNDSCLQCHGSSQTRGVPGHLVRSIYPDRQGQPLLAMGSFRVDQTTPFEKRWGGWYVTGTHGSQKHLGNLIVKDRLEPEEVENEDGLNVTELKDRFFIDNYLTPHSDLVALMVLEHQAEAHNLLTRANFQARRALHDEEALNKELGRKPAYPSETTFRRIRSAADPLIKYLLFSGEAKLTEPIRGTSEFAEEFTRRGPRDAQGRSLRDLDLETRLFKYPCSYLIDSPSFDALPEPLKDYVLRRMHTILTTDGYLSDFEHLRAEDRRAILEILRATKPDLPDYWHEEPGS